MHEAKSGMEIRVKDVQNRPPVFQGSLAAVIDEDSPIGTLVMTIQAKDGDYGQPRKIAYDLLSSKCRITLARQHLSLTYSPSYLSLSLSSPSTTLRRLLRSDGLLFAGREIRRVAYGAAAGPRSVARCNGAHHAHCSGKFPVACDRSNYLT